MSQYSLAGVARVPADLAQPGAHPPEIVAISPSQPELRYHPESDAISTHRPCDRYHIGDRTQSKLPDIPCIWCGCPIFNGWKSGEVTCASCESGPVDNVTSYIQIGRDRLRSAGVTARYQLVLSPTGEFLVEKLI